MESKFYKDPESVKNYIQSTEKVNSYQLIDKYNGFLAPHSNLLELGSGPGTDWNYLNNHHNTIGSDYSEAFVEHLRKKHPEASFLLLDAITLKTEFQFDGIYSNKLFQHLTDTEIEFSIKNQLQILNKDGIICHSFWKGKGEEFFKGMYVNYQTLDTLKSLFSKSFEILILEEYQEFEPNDSLVIIAKKNQNKHSLI